MATVMKYLKRFNESNFDPKVLSWIKDNLDMIPINDSQYRMAKLEYDFAKLKEFCEKNLAYLIDEGYYFDVESLGDYSKIRITFKGKDIVWDNIKDDLLPFIELLREKYDIDNRETEEVLIWARPKNRNTFSKYDPYYFSIDELLNDEINLVYSNFNSDLIQTIEIDVLDSEK